MALPFGVESTSRIATGSPLGLFEALGVVGAGAALAPWLLVIVASLGTGGPRTRSAIRGIAGVAGIVGLVWLSGGAAERSVVTIGGFARYSIGGGVWLAVFSGFTLIMSSRRELGASSKTSAALMLAAPAGVVALALSGALSSLGMAAEYRNVADDFWSQVGLHLFYSAVTMVVAVALGVTLGIVAFRIRRFERPIFAVLSVFQTIPGLAMVGILVVPLAALSQAVPALRALGVGGIGWAPLLIALALYALLAVVRNTFAGLASVPEEAVDAGRGMGMTGGQLLRRVELPLAVPVLFSGARTAAQQTVGNATLGAFVAAGGLGPFIFLGIAQQAMDLVLLGSIALVLLALSVDIVLRGLQRALSPRPAERSTA